MLYEYLEKIKDFFVWVFNSEAHVQVWNDLGPI